MLILKHLKTLQHVLIIIQIIFRELVGSLLKSLNLKFFKFSDFNKEPTSSLDDLNDDRNMLDCF